MGSFEKLVVLTVLFLVVVVLGITLTPGESDSAPAASGPLASALDRAEGGPADPGSFLGGREAEAPATPPAKEEAAPLGLLSATLGDDSLLRSADGLEDAPMIPDFKIYRVAAGDTWTALSQRFYGTANYAALLRRANDEPESLRAGMQILVPVRDFTEDAGTRPRATPSRAVSTPADPVAAFEPVTTPRRGRSTPAPVEDSLPTPPVNRVTEYEVQPGDSLSVISLKVYGTSRRWEEIYAANTDLLPDPDSLQVGDLLQIP